MTNNYCSEENTTLIVSMYSDKIPIRDICFITECTVPTIRKVLLDAGLIVSCTFIDITGCKFGGWTVLRYDGIKKGLPYWWCKCACGSERSVKKFSLLSGVSRSCGCLIANRPRYQKRAGVHEHYKWVRCTGHPNSSKKGYILEHTLVMSKYLGRPIEKCEKVHHKNGLKRDNSLGNLELCTTIHPPSQRVDDLIEFCICFLSKYQPDVLIH